MAKLKWSKLALDAYRNAGDDMRVRGFRAMREIKDPDVGSLLTLWSGPYGQNAALRVIIQQTWVDTGDVCFYSQCDMPPLPVAVAAGADA